MFKHNYKILEVSCFNRQPPANGIVLDATTEPYGVGDRIEFRCNPGYFMTGESVSECTESGEWNRALPTCRGDFYVSSKFQVNFGFGIALISLDEF